MTDSDSDSLISTFITSGIQILYLIPFLQTKDCEVHLGNVLTRGYLFSAVAPLSIFGSLGTLRQGFILWLLTAASTEERRSFLRKLLPVGFEPKGDVSTLLTIKAGTKQYVAETRLTRIINRLDDNKVKTLEARMDVGNWWFLAILCSLLGVLISITPYIPSVVVLPVEKSVFIIALSFPLIRALGSLLITVSSQLILQHEIMNLVKNRILYAKIDKIAGDAVQKLSDVKWSGDVASGECLRTLARRLTLDGVRHSVNNTKPHGGKGDPDLESAQGTAPEPGPSSSKELRGHPRRPGATLDDVYSLLKEHVDRQRIPKLWKAIQHLVLLVGMLCSAYGYFGCFTLVQNNPPTALAPALWLILEIVLAIIRLLIWAWNPRFDENTALILSFCGNDPNSGAPSTAGSSVDWKVTWGLTLSPESSAGCFPETQEELPSPEVEIAVAPDAAYSAEEEWEDGTVGEQDSIGLLAWPSPDPI